MRGKRARCLALHKSKFEYGRGRRSPAGLSASFHVGSYFCVSPWGSCCPFGLWPRVRGTRNDPGREKAEDRKRRGGGRRMEEREKEPGKGVKGEKKRDSRTYARAWRGRRRKREREERSKRSRIVRKNRRPPDVRPEYKREIVSFFRHRGPFMPGPATPSVNNHPVHHPS